MVAYWNKIFISRFWNIEGRKLPTITNQISQLEESFRNIASAKTVRQIAFL